VKLDPRALFGRGPFGRSPYGTGALVVAVLLGGVGFLPLFGGPGYEQALATGLLCPTAAAVATSLDVARGGARSPLASVGRGVLAGLGFAFVALVTALLHAARVGICELWGALLYFGLTAAAGSVMGGAWGAVVGEAVRARAPKRVRLACIAISLAGPLGCALTSVWRFYSSPMIFAFDPFVGYFSGTLYDTVIEPGLALLTYRLGSLATLIALALVASVLERTERGFVLALRGAPERARFALGVLAAASSLGVFFAGTQLGHFSTSASIAKDLGAEKHGARCDVVYPSTTREQEANLLVKDCEEELAAVEKRLGAHGPDRVRAFFFRNADDKKRLMGAANTYIAKPWREEVYLQLGSYPHPVLGHELAHVVAGSFGRGPFRVAGLVPNPGLIEGVAVFASPDDEDLTDAQWAHAMLRLGILPDMRRVFSLGFLGDASAKSYTLAGAFIDWVAGRFGLDVVRAWYGGGDVEALTAMKWPELQSAFRAHVEQIPLPPEAEAFARARFARPGIFGRKCPHVVDALRHEADVCRDSQRYAEAIRLYREAIGKDSVDFASKKEVAVVERRHGDKERGRGELEALVNDEAVPRTWRDRADEALADAELLDDDFEHAARRYDELAARSVDEDVARTIEIKALAARDPDARPAIQALLLGDAKHGPDVFVAGIDLGTWDAKARNDAKDAKGVDGAHAAKEVSDAQGSSGLANYLIGRNVLARGFFELGAHALDVALASPLPTPRVAREALRQRAIAACAMSDQPALAALRARIESPADPFKGASGGRRASTLRMIARCTR
jgi:tetratricopeptide (TPR) repeat protein